jgi:preprotein translocase subunit SecG
VLLRRDGRAFEHSNERLNMSTLETVLVILLVADALALATLVMLQQGKGAEVGAAFGSGSANTVFGSAGSASFLTKLTVWLAIGFFLISFALAYTAKERAAATDAIGIPQVPVEQAEGARQQLTPQPERVDSDIPDA